MVKKLRCKRCNHKWKQRKKKKPKYCPSCHSPNWDIPTAKNYISFLIE
jgi:Zn finger protein HypA/HybF involved in hydrogenase expression